MAQASNYTEHTQKKEKKKKKKKEKILTPLPHFFS